MTFGQRLRLLRDLAGYTSDAALEDAAGLTRGDFSRWAKDEYRPGPVNRATLARVLGVDLETLDGEGEGWQAIVRRQEVIRRAHAASDDEIARALSVLSPAPVCGASTRRSPARASRSPRAVAPRRIASQAPTPPTPTPAPSARTEEAP